METIDHLLLKCSVSQTNRDLLDEITGTVQKHGNSEEGQPPMSPCCLRITVLEYGASGTMRLTLFYQLACLHLLRERGREINTSSGASIEIEAWERHKL